MCCNIPEDGGRHLRLLVKQVTCIHAWIEKEYVSEIWGNCRGVLISISVGWKFVSLNK